MKKIFVILCATLVVISFATALVGAANVSPGLCVIAYDDPMTVSALTGETVVFGEEQFNVAVGKTSDYEIKITELPDSEKGVLCLGDVEVTEGQVISSEHVSMLSFAPNENTTSASFEFFVDDAYAMTCNVLFSTSNNASPTAIEQNALKTFQNTAVSGQMRAADPEEDDLYYEVVDYPEGGTLSFNSKTGEFCYTAGSRVMEDSFTYRVKDSFGNYSDTVSCAVTVTENKSETVFCDMSESTSLTSATEMADCGYMSCFEKDGETYFSPDLEVSRLDFLVSAMNVFGAARIPNIKDTGFYDDSDIPDEYKGYVYSAAKLGIINGVNAGENVCFNPNEPVTKAQAAVILNNIVGYNAKHCNSVSGTPEWAESAVCAMYELGVYDTQNGNSKADCALTREDSANMLYRISCLLYE